MCSSEYQALVSGEYVAVVIHQLGIYGITDGGKYTKLTKDQNTSALTSLKYVGPLGLPEVENDGRDFAIVSLGAVGVGKVYREGVESMRGGGWMLAKAMVKPIRTPGYIVFHDHGLYRVILPCRGSLGEATAEKLSRGTFGGWSQTKAVVHDESTDTATVFHDSGIFRVDLADGHTAKLCSSRWNQTKAAVLGPTGILVFHDQGLFRVRVEDGAWQQITSDRWALVRGAVDAGDGTALVFHEGGLYKVCLETGAFMRIESAGTWGGTVGIWPVLPTARSVCHTVARGHHHNLTGAQVGALH